MKIIYEICEVESHYSRKYDHTSFKLLECLYSYDTKEEAVEKIGKILEECPYSVLTILEKYKVEDLCL